MDITATKAIDSLLGVSDQEKAKIFLPSTIKRRFAKDTTEDRPLARIGVLKLVN